MKEELERVRYELDKLKLQEAALRSKLDCLEKFERQESENIRGPKEGFCVFDHKGRPMLWTIRVSKDDVLRKFSEFKSLSPAHYGYTIGPCIVKPIIRV